MPKPDTDPAALDASRWRHLFPITREIVHLNHAGVSPVSTRVVDAMTGFLDLSSRTGILHYAEMEARAERAREKFARLIHAAADEIAFIKNTSEGLARVANGIAWRDGDRIVTTNLEYPSNVYPGMPRVPASPPTAGCAWRISRPRSRRRRASWRSPSRFRNGFRNDLETLGRM
jgi:hypothetical protein